LISLNALSASAVNYLFTEFKPFLDLDESTLSIVLGYSISAGDTTEFGFNSIGVCSLGLLLVVVKFFDDYIALMLCQIARRICWRNRKEKEVEKDEEVPAENGSVVPVATEEEVSEQVNYFHLLRLLALKRLRRMTNSFQSVLGGAPQRCRSWFSWHFEPRRVGCGEQLVRNYRRHQNLESPWCCTGNARCTRGF